MPSNRTSYPKQDCYETLGVDPSAPQEVIEAAWKALNRKHHPDHKPPEERAAANEVLKAINEAYECLKNLDSRREYDAWREQQAPGSRHAHNPPEPHASPATLDFGTLTRGSSRTLQLTVENRGGPVHEVEFALDDDESPFSVSVRNGDFPMILDVTLDTGRLPAGRCDEKLTVCLDGISLVVALRGLVRVPAAASPPRPSTSAATPPPMSPPSASSAGSWMALVLIAAIVMLIVVWIGSRHDAPESENASETGTVGVGVAGTDDTISSAGGQRSVGRIGGTNAALQLLREQGKGFVPPSGRSYLLAGRNGDIWAIDVSSLVETQLTSTSRVSSFSASPSGTVAYTQGRGNHYTSPGDLYLLGSTDPIARGVQLSYVRVSMDGRYVFYQRSDGLSEYPVPGDSGPTRIERSKIQVYDLNDQTEETAISSEDFPFPAVGDSALLPGLGARFDRWGGNRISLVSPDGRGLLFDRAYYVWERGDCGVTSLLMPNWQTGRAVFIQRPERGIRCVLSSQWFNSILLLSEVRGPFVLVRVPDMQQFVLDPMASDGVFDPSISPDGKAVAYVSETNGSLMMVSTETGISKVLGKLPRGINIYYLLGTEWAPDASAIVVDSQGKALLWRRSTGTIQEIESDWLGDPTWVVFPDGVPPLVSEAGQMGGSSGGIPESVRVDLGGRRGRQ